MIGINTFSSAVLGRKSWADDLLATFELEDNFWLTSFSLLDEVKTFRGGACATNATPSFITLQVRVRNVWQEARGRSTRQRG